MGEPDHVATTPPAGRRRNAGRAAHGQRATRLAERADAIAFWCVLAPAAVPPPILAAFHAALVEALAPAEIRQRMLATLGIEVVASSSEEFGRYLNDQMDLWARVIRERNIRAD